MAAPGGLHLFQHVRGQAPNVQGPPPAEARPRRSAHQSLHDDERCAQLVHGQLEEAFLQGPQGVVRELMQLTMPPSRLPCWSRTGWPWASNHR